VCTHSCILCIPWTDTGQEASAAECVQTYIHTYITATDTGQKTTAAEAGNKDSQGPAALRTKAAAAREAAEAARRRAAAAREAMVRIKCDERAAADRYPPPHTTHNMHVSSSSYDT
jgi:hypothetical protein